MGLLLLLLLVDVMLLETLLLRMLRIVLVRMLLMLVVVIVRGATYILIITVVTMPSKLLLGSRIVQLDVFEPIGKPRFSYTYVRPVDNGSVAGVQRWVV